MFHFGMHLQVGLLCKFFATLWTLKLHVLSVVLCGHVGSQARRAPEATAAQLTPVSVLPLMPLLVCLLPMQCHERLVALFTSIWFVNLFFEALVFVIGLQRGECCAACGAPGTSLSNNRDKLLHVLLNSFDWVVIHV